MNSIEKNKNNLYAKSIAEKKNKRSLPSTFGIGQIKMCDLLQPVISFEDVPLATPNGIRFESSLIFHESNFILFYNNTKL